jgi:hypothetical protein
MWRTERPAFQLARSLLMLTMPGAFAWAVMAGISAEFVWAVFWIAPLLIIAFAGVALGERPPPAVLIAGALGAVAAAAIFGHLSAASPSFTLQECIEWWPLPSLDDENRSKVESEKSGN